MLYRERRCKILSRLPDVSLWHAILNPKSCTPWNWHFNRKGWIQPTQERDGIRKEFHISPVKLSYADLSILSGATCDVLSHPSISVLSSFASRSYENLSSPYFLSHCFGPSVVPFHYFGPSAIRFHRFRPSAVRFHRFGPSAIGFYRFGPSAVRFHCFGPSAVRFHRFGPSDIQFHRFGPSAV